MESKDLQEVVLCSCSSSEHQLIFRGLSDENEVYVNIHLYTHDNFFKRLWAGFKYALGYKSRFGAWDEVVLGKEHIEQIKKVIEHLEVELPQ